MCLSGVDSFMKNCPHALSTTTPSPALSFTRMYKISKVGFRDSYICGVNHISPAKKYVPIVKTIARACSSLCLEIDISNVSNQEDMIERSFTPRNVFMPLDKRLSSVSYQVLIAGKSDAAKSLFDTLSIDDVCIIHTQCVVTEELTAVLRTANANLTSDENVTDTSSRARGTCHSIDGLQSLETMLWNSPHFLRKRG